MESSFKPDAKVRDLTESNLANQKTCIIVFNVENSWGATNALEKLGAILYSSNILIKSERKETVHIICEQYKLTYADNYPSPEDWESERRKNTLNKLKLLKDIKKAEFESLALKYGNKYSSIDELLIDDVKENLLKTPDGRKLLKILYDYKNQEEQIARLGDPSLPTNTNESLNDEKKFRHLFEPITREKYVELLKNRLPEVSTGYTIGDVAVNFPSGAISVVFLPTGHGKTGTTINYCLGALKNNPGKIVHFFTYEQPVDEIITLFINAYVGIELDKRKNKEKINEHFTTSNIESVLPEIYEEFKKKAEEFFDTVMNNGRLIIHYAYGMPIEDLAEAIESIKKENPNTALIAIDYIQKLKSENSTKPNRQLELKDICSELLRSAISTGFPIVVAAQVNREVKTERDLRLELLREAADIEHMCAFGIGGFNRAKYNENEKYLDKKGHEIQKEDAIYYEVFKSRNTRTGDSAVMKYDGNIGKLLPNKGESSSNPAEGEITSLIKKTLDIF